MPKLHAPAIEPDHTASEPGCETTDIHNLGGRNERKKNIKSNMKNVAMYLSRPCRDHLGHKLPHPGHREATRGALWYRLDAIESID